MKSWLKKNYAAIFVVTMAATPCYAQQTVVIPASSAFQIYAAGTWTPTDNSGASLSFTSVSTKYVRNGNFVFATATFTFPTTADASQVQISGLPIAVLGARSVCPVSTNAGVAFEGVAFEGTQFFRILTAAGTGVLNSALSGVQVSITCTYSI